MNKESRYHHYEIQLLETDQWNTCYTYSGTSQCLELAKKDMEELRDSARSWRLVMVETRVTIRVIDVIN